MDLTGRGRGAHRGVRGNSGGVQGRGGNARGRGRRSLDFTNTSKSDQIVPRGSLDSALPQPSTCFTEEIKKVRKGKEADKKKLTRLNAAQREKLQEDILKKEVMHFLLPDAPPSKRKRNSPERSPCPLMPGVPVTPPSPVKQPWQLAREATKSSVAPVVTSHPDRPLDVEAGTSSSALVPVPGSSQNSLELTAPAIPDYMILTSSTDEGNPVENIEILDVDIELVGFSSGQSPFEDIEDHELEGNLHADFAGGTLDDDDDDGLQVDGKAPVYLATAEDLEPGLAKVLDSIHRQDDASLRQLASDDLLEFDWSADPNVFTGEREEFLGPSGPTFDTEGLSPFEIFTKFWNYRIMQKIVIETNRYAADLMAKANQGHKQKWAPITVAELWQFLGITMLHSIISINVEREYWYPKKPYLKIGNLNELMAYARFTTIKRCLHFVDDRELPSNPDKLAKIEPILKHLNRKFSSLYLPEQEIAIDESLLLWKGRLSFAQLMAHKAAQVGIKSYELCESKSGYLWSFIIYAGKSSSQHTETVSDEPEGSTSKIVYNLLRPLLNKGYTVVMDNYYNSPLLSRSLKRQKTDTFGTLRLNREFVPESLKLKTKINMRTGEVAISHTKDLNITVWKDCNNVVPMISSYHKTEVGGKEKHGLYKYKPKVVLDYNLSMGGVDKKDQLLQAYPVERIRNSVWYKKLFRRLLNVSILNTYVIFKRNKSITHRQFRTDLLDEIINRFWSIKPCTAVKPCKSDSHFPARNESKHKRCKHCAKKNLGTRTSYMCKACNVDLCILCFEPYHKALQSVEAHSGPQVP